MSEYAEVREHLITQLCRRKGWPRDSYDADIAIEEVDWFLSLPGVVVLANKQTFPEFLTVNGDNVMRLVTDTRQAMWDAGFRRIVERPKP